MAQSDLMDPKEAAPAPPFPKQHQEPPGVEAEMDPRPDYGEQSYKGSGKLQDRVALITGGDSGIGRAVALAFAREGADIAISYLDEEVDANETKRVVEGSGRRCLKLPGDIRDERHCKHMVERVASEFGRLDILVNNAGFQMAHKKFVDISSEEIERVFQTNLLPIFWVCKAAIPHLKAGASIINTASIEAFKPTPMLPHYAATKGAIVTLTKALAHELAEQGVRVNAVAPGPVWTPLIMYSFPPEQIAKFGHTTPLKRPAQPAELAPVYVLLASDDGSYVTGVTYGVTGGMLMV